MVFLHIAAPWSIVVFRIVKNRYTRSSSPRCLLCGRRRWAPMPEAMEPSARGSFSRWTRWCGSLASLRRLPDDSSALRPIYFCAAPLDRYLVSCTAASITVGVSRLVASIQAQWRSHLPRFWNAHRASRSILLVFTGRMMPVGTLLWGRHP